MEISIHALLAESDGKSGTQADPAKSISIHALLAESDWIHPVRPTANSISIHALLAESDGRITSNGTKKLNFYPRSPCGERHKLHINRPAIAVNFYPRSPCGERQLGENHANSQQEFLSTLSLRRATRYEHCE